MRFIEIEPLVQHRAQLLEQRPLLSFIAIYELRRALSDVCRQHQNRIRRYLYRSAACCIGNRAQGSSKAGLGVHRAAVAGVEIHRKPSTQSIIGDHRLLRLRAAVDDYDGFPVGTLAFPARRSHMERGLRAGRLFQLCASRKRAGKDAPGIEPRSQCHAIRRA